MANDTTDSPHLLIPRLGKTALLIAIAQNDDERKPQEKILLREAADKAGEITTQILKMFGVYDETQAERAWARMLATLSKNL